MDLMQPVPQFQGHFLQKKKKTLLKIETQKTPNIQKYCEKEEQSRILQCYTHSGSIVLVQKQIVIGTELKVQK